MEVLIEEQAYLCPECGDRIEWSGITNNFKQNNKLEVVK